MDNVSLKHARIIAFIAVCCVLILGSVGIAHAADSNAAALQIKPLPTFAHDFGIVPLISLAATETTETTKTAETTETATTHFIIQYSPMNGQEALVATVTAGDALGTLPAAPTYAGHTFAGWFTAPESGTELTAAYTPTSDETFYAHWNVDATTTYTVAFNTGGGSSVATQTIDAGALVGEPTTPTRSGFEFAGWREGAVDGPLYDFSTPVNADLVLYASWIESESSTVAVTFNPENGSSPLEYSFLKGTKIGTLNEPTRTGYTFVGWFTAPTGGTQITSSYVVSSDLTLYAHWTEATQSAYIIQFDPQNSQDAIIVNITPGAALGALPDAPAREGYTFDGWFTAQESGTEITAATVPTSDTTYYAHWTKDAVVVPAGKVCVYFDPRGGNYVGKRIVTEGTAIGTLPRTLRKGGYSFGGWYAMPGAKGARITSNTKLTENTVVFARWLSQNDRLRAITKTSGRWGVKFSAKKKTSKIIVPCKKPRTTIRFYKANAAAKMYVRIDHHAWKRIDKITMKAGRKMRYIDVKVVAQDNHHVRYYTVKVVDP